MREPERVQTLIIGAGQSGLSVAHHLARRGQPFVIVEAKARVGDVWRERWDSLRLFTPARFDGLPGMRFPAARGAFPTKDEMGDFLEAYARRFDLRVRTGVRVDRLTRRGDAFVAQTSAGEIEAANVVVAMANYQRPLVPEYASRLEPAIVQLHSKEYRSPAQLRDGTVLVAGAGNSGAEIALEVARTGRKVILAGRPTGEVPFRVDSFLGVNFFGPLVLRFVFHRLLTLATPLGRKAHQRATSQGGPLIRVKSRTLAAAGVERAGRVVGVHDGQPVLADGRTLDVASVVWCTGFDPGFSWIDLPVFGARGAPVHDRGVSRQEPGLYFVGLHFLFSLSSTMIHAADRDGDHVAAEITARARALGEAPPARAGAGARRARGVGAGAA